MFEIVTLNELQDALASSPHDWELVYDGLVDEVAECNHLVVYSAGHVLFRWYWSLVLGFLTVLVCMLFLMVMIHLLIKLRCMMFLHIHFQMGL